MAIQTNSKINPWLIAIAVILPTFIEVLDTTVVSVALENIAGNLAATVSQATWIQTGYLISNAIVLPASAWFSALFGRKRFLMVCIGIFTLASLACGAAPNLTFLIFASIVQGAGGGALQPISQAILMESFPPAKRGSGHGGLRGGRRRWHPWWDRSWAAGSPTIIPGAGFSTSTSRAVWLPCG